MKTLKLTVGVILMMVLTACGATGIDETYAGGGHEFAFSSDGTVVQSYMGKRAAKYKYEVQGSAIRVFVNENTTLNCTLEKGKGLRIPNVPFVLTLKR
jgi:hypothetical protein